MRVVAPFSPDMEPELATSIIQIDNQKSGQKYRHRKSFYAHRGGGAARRKRTTKIVWRDRTGRLLAYRRAPRSKLQCDAFRQRRFENSCSPRCGLPSGATAF